MKYFVLILMAGFFIGPARAERWEYISEVNREIPDFDSIGVTDTIFVPVHAAIEDINFFVGIGELGGPWAEQVWIDVFSPGGLRVRINDWGGEPINWYHVWYDTERQVDGPGSLDDYVGLDSYGPWVMHAFDMFPDRVVNWYNWKIEVFGDETTSVADENLSGIPDDFKLLGNYPNPFNSSTAIKFGLPEEAAVKIQIYDTLGRLVRSLLDRTLPAGYHRVIWNGRNNNAEQVASGTYLIRMQTSEKIFDKSMILLK